MTLVEPSWRVTVSRRINVRVHGRAASRPRVLGLHRAPTDLQLHRVRRNKVDAVFKTSAMYHTPRRPPAMASLALLAMACVVPSTVGLGLFVPASFAFMPSSSLPSRPTLTNSW